MSAEKTDISGFLSLAKRFPVADVRSPGEYRHAHIPGAFSLPLFTDEERKIIGTTYKQQSRELAIKAGLEFFGPRMKQLVEEAEAICQKNNSGKTILVHCWRGGMRSGAVSWLLDLYGFKVYTLTGGYKKFRNYVLDLFRQPFAFNILGGYTGSGKTPLLTELEQKGEVIIDLEALACHKGSAFGNIGMPAQPGQEMFENRLALVLTEKKALAGNKRIWLEDESQRLGLVNLPHELWATMRQSPLFFLEIPFEERLKHICREYGALNLERMLHAIGRIKDKLGDQQARLAAGLLQEGDIAGSFRILLRYYDKFYLKALHNREGLNTLLHTIDCKSVTSENADLLVSMPEYQQERL